MKITKLKGKFWNKTKKAQRKLFKTKRKGASEKTSERKSAGADRHCPSPWSNAVCAVP